ncbi:MAG: acyl-CoA thioesterase [Burkholderiales bacterium]
MTFIETIEVRWGDMDALGHVNNAVYFRYMEQARISWLTGLRSDIFMREEGPILVAARCNFIRPIVYPATIAVSCTVGELKRSSFPIIHEITLANDVSVRFAEGEVTTVWVNYKLGKSVPLPEWLRAAAVT